MTTTDLLQLIGDGLTFLALIGAVVATKFAADSAKAAKETVKPLQEMADRLEQSVIESKKVLAATETVTSRIESTIQSLELLQAETQAMREVEQLARVADQAGTVIALMRQVRDAPLSNEQPPRWELGEQQRLLATHLSGLPAATLDECRAIADPTNSKPWTNLDGWHAQASQELKAAMSAAASRLAEASARLTSPDS